MNLSEVFKDFSMDVESILDDSLTYKGDEVILTPNPGVIITSTELFDRE